jgi:biopolymer transport protein ExbD
MSKSIRKNFKNYHVDEPSVNLTPLIDVVFVILIMFILVAPLLELDRIELADSAAKPGDKTVEVHEASPMTIHVQRDNTILFNKQKVTFAELKTLLTQAQKSYPNARPQVYHDKAASFGTYQSIKNILEEVGFQQMDIILKPS